MKGGDVDCAASYTSCEGCVAPQTDRSGARAPPCHWNMEAGACQRMPGVPTAKFCSGPFSSTTVKCNKCKSDWEAYQKVNAAKIAEQSAAAARKAEAVASGKDIGAGAIAGFKSGFCRPTGTILKGVCVAKAADCTGGRSVQRADECESCCMLRPTQKKTREQRR